MIGALIDRHGRKMVLASILVVTALRAAYALLVMDPFTGPDADTYHQSAAELASKGFLAEINAFPYFPFGYPLFISAFYAIAGPIPEVATVGQVILSGIALYSLYAFSTREFGPRVGAVAGLMAAWNPALFAITTQLMYEALLFIGVAIGLDLVSRGTRPGSVRSGIAVGGFLVLGLTSTANGQVLLVGLLVLGWLIWRHRLSAFVLFCAAALVLPPLAQATRNLVVAETFAMSTNVGINVLIGHNDNATGDNNPAFETPGCRIDSRDQNEWQQQHVGCAARWAVSHPVREAELVAIKSWFFWNPMTGPLAETGTWAHAFDLRRPIPTGIRAMSWFAPSWLVLSVIWNVFYLGLLLAGLIWGLRDRRTRAGVWLCLLVISAIMAVSLITFGDARHRLAAAPAYIPVEALALVRILRIEPNPEVMEDDAV